MLILLLEDDLETASLLEDGLVHAGHGVAVASDAQAALLLAQEQLFDVAVIDRMLPGSDGLSLVRAWRKAGQRTPVLMLSAMGAIADRVEGLEAGADDYLIKPFAMEELLARIVALKRRSAEDNPRLCRVGDLTIDMALRRVQRRGHEIRLQPREFDLLAILSRNPGRPVTRKMILAEVWAINFDPNTNFVESHISRLRTKLRQHGPDPIETLQGLGYRLRNDV